jgi:hypothetical protein
MPQSGLPTGDLSSFVPVLSPRFGDEHQGDQSPMFGERKSDDEKTQKR